MVATLLSVLSYFLKMSDGQRERTFIMVKPDGVQRGLVGEIIKRFENRGYKLVAMKMCMPGLKHIQEHYADLSKKGFFAGLCEYINSGPVVPMVWEGNNVVAAGRVLLGETNPQASKPGTIRGDFCVEVGRNVCHGSDGVDSAKKEISHWFKDAELNNYASCQEKWVYE